jgi:hypothetical protein
VAVEGLLDSGAEVNVLPWRVGEALGAVWDPRKATLRLAGALAGTLAMPLLVEARVNEFAPVRLAFAWCHTDEVPLALGQTNFFMDVPKDITACKRVGSPRSARRWRRGPAAGRS